MVTGSAGIASLEVRAKVARVAIWAVIVAIAPVVALYSLLIIGQLGMGFPSPTLYAIIFFGNLLVAFLFALSAIAVLVWFHRAHANLHEAGLDELRYSPAWAVGSWFIPGVNFVVPFTSTRALHNRSHGEEPWNTEAAVGDVTSWWTCHLAGTLILAFTTVTFLINLIPGVFVTTPPAADTALNIAGYLLLVGAAWLLKSIIMDVTEAQKLGMGSASVFD